MPKLSLIKKGEVITHFNLPDGGVGIGRSAVNEIQLKAPSVSERHARIFTSESSSSIKDLNSALGTFVNDRSISRCELRNNDIILIGSYKLHFQQDEANQQTAQTPADTASVPESEAAPPLVAEPEPESAYDSDVGSGDDEAFAPSAQLLVLNGVNEGGQLPLGHDRISLGKNQRRSLIIDLVGREYVASSVAGVSKVALNGKPLREPAVLCDDDELLVEDVTLRFVSDRPRSAD